MIRRECDWHESRLAGLEQQVHDVVVSVTELKGAIDNVKTELIGVVMALKNRADRREKYLLIVITALVGGILGQVIPRIVTTLVGT